MKIYNHITVFVVPINERLTDEGLQVVGYFEYGMQHPYQYAAISLIEAIKNEPELCNGTIVFIDKGSKDKFNRTEYTIIYY